MTSSTEPVLGQQSASQLLMAYARGQRTFHGWDLVGADLRACDLRGVNL